MICIYKTLKCIDNCIYKIEKCIYKCNDKRGICNGKNKDFELED